MPRGSQNATPLDIESDGVTPEVDINAIILENARLKQALNEKEKMYADVEKRIAKIEKNGVNKTNTISLICTVDVAPGIVHEIWYEGNRPNGKRVVFTKFNQIRNLTIDEFRAFASSEDGSSNLNKRYVIAGGDGADDILKEYGLEYKDGELIKEHQLKAVLDMPSDKLANLYKGLCQNHKRAIVRRFADAWSKRDRRVSRDKVAAMNAVDPDGYTKQMLKQITAKEAADI